MSFAVQEQDKLYVHDHAGNQWGSRLCGHTGALDMSDRFSIWGQPKREQEIFLSDQEFP